MVGRWAVSCKLIPGYRPLGQLANADLPVAQPTLGAKLPFLAAN